MATIDQLYVDQVIEYRPRVTGGIVVGVITSLHTDPRFGSSVTFRVTDGTRVYPPGLVECIDVEDVRLP